VVIGMDPHKRSVTIEVMAGDETVSGGRRFVTDRDGFPQMLARVKAWPSRVWAIEGCSGIGRPRCAHVTSLGRPVAGWPPSSSAATRGSTAQEGRQQGAEGACCRNRHHPDGSIRHRTFRGSPTAVRGTA